jgi:predicted adenine nucleotide alpha hydrolase (AANH) superfamily ATPase
MSKPRLLVHACCAPDGLYVMGLLRDEYEATAFFYNPNIFPAEEYGRRLQDVEKAGRLKGFPLIVEPRDHERWLEMTRKFKDEPEMGRRCDICYALRLNRAGRVAACRGFDMFTTVMSLSPHKNAESLNRIGRMLGGKHGVTFLEADFKKKDGFNKSVSLSRGLDLYRQDYCGCPYSRRPPRP